MGGAGPDEPAGRVGDNLHAHAVAAVFTGVVRLLVGDAVDRDQRAVQDRVGRQPDPVHRGVQVVGRCREQIGGFADVAPGCGHADVETAGRPGQGVAVAQGSGGGGIAAR
jgi:hypothetical protein